MHMVPAAGRTVPATRRFGGGERLVHDAPNGACATPALYVAPQAMVDLFRGAWGVFTRGKRQAHVVVGQHVAGADNHYTGGRCAYSFDLKSSIVQASAGCKEKITFYRDSNLESGSLEVSLNINHLS